MTVPLPSIVTDRYTIERQIGAGGMATVYLARDAKHDREVALKVLRPELGAVLGADRFLSEIKITARLDHPHILTLIDSGVADGLLYYVLPFVRGESLRDLLNRETQLSIDDALFYTKQVGSALDYAHRHGVIHRDIKPENILIQEGEAILTDFGIALAVKEAGGSRLTETGLSLGTPQYMSPEQATGDKALGPKSDQYSLAAVLYEMLTGEPPISGANSQSIIAKLLTEEPTHIRTVRKTVAPGIDAAVAKALAKSPADRFASIGDFLRALDTAKTGATETVSSAPAAKKRNIALIAGVTAVVAVAAAFAIISSKNSAPKSAPIALRDRTQLTYSGSIIAPAMSGDGKQLAYFKRTCPTEVCTYGIVVQDVGSTEGRTILDGFSSGLGLEWSPDRRNVLMQGTINGRYGIYLVPVLGGAPRLVSASTATFYAGGDSLLVGPKKFTPDRDSTYTISVTGLSGDVGSTFKLRGGGEMMLTMGSIPGTTRIVFAVITNGKGLWQIADRQGNVTSKLLNDCTCGGMASGDAVWMARAGASAGEAIVHIAIDPATGRFSQKQDTIYSGRFSGFSASADGTKFIVDDGTTEFNVAYGTVADMMGRNFDRAQTMKSSNNLSAVISPDGNRLLKRQSVPDGRGGSTQRISMLPFGGGAETAVETDGKVVVADWADSVSVWIATQVYKGMHLTVVDTRNGAHRNDYYRPDSIGIYAAPLPDGWVYVPINGDRMQVIRNGKTRDILKSPWFTTITGISVSPDASRAMYWGWNTGSNDSTGFVVVPLDGSAPPAQVLTSFAERFWGSWMNDGSFLARIWLTPDAATLMKIKFPSGVERIGTVPHVSVGMSVSADMKHATLMWRDSHADAYMYRVAKQ